VSTRIVGGRYRLLREIGRGGMATVHLAVDEKHQRQVALKMLRPELAALVGPERFLREIDITAALNHPHILPLLDSGADGGIVYYVMPYVAGGSLRLLMSAGPVPLEAVTRIARETASALDYAHTRGVVHRDIKPENILFNEGVAVVSDFGIARAVGDAAGTRMTGTGLSVGTLGYMSPEQALGTPDLDARTDVYSLGCVVYEMLVGERPASWPGAEDIELGRIADAPPAHRTRLDGYPGRVEQVLARALALRPRHRYSTAGELAAALTAASERTTGFTDEEVRQLLRRAAELQAEAPDAARPEELTIGAVEQIAAQVGIPPVHIREAAREMERLEPVTVVTAAAGGDWRRLRQRWDRLLATETVAGRVPNDAYPAMVAEIERRLGVLGHTSIVGGTLTWSPATQGEESRSVVIQVSARDDATDIRVQENLEIRGVRKLAIPLGGLFGGGFGAAFGAALGMGPPGAPILAVMAAVASMIGAVRIAISLDAASRAPGLRDLAASLVALARAAAEQHRPVADDARPTPAVDR